MKRLALSVISVCSLAFGDISLGPISGVFTDGPVVSCPSRILNGDQPITIYQSPSKTRTKWGFVAVHGLSESSRGMEWVAKLYSEFGNVYAPVLRGHGKTQEVLADAKLEDWQIDIAQSVVHAKKHLADNIVLVGFSLGAALSLVHQINALEQQDSALRVQGLSLHSPVFLKGKKFDRFIARSFGNLERWLNANPHADQTEYPYFFEGLHKEFTLKTPLTAFRELTRLQSENQRRLSTDPNQNSGIEILRNSGSIIGAIFSTSDKKIDSTGTLEYVERITQSEQLLLYLSPGEADDIKFEHEDSVRPPVGDNIGFPFDIRVGQNIIASETFTREEAVRKYIRDYLKMLESD